MVRLFDCSTFRQILKTMKKSKLCLLAILICGNTQAAKVFTVSALDKNIVMLHILDGEVIRRDDGTGKCAFLGHCHSPDGSSAIYFGAPLHTGQASMPTNWVITSENDPNYVGQGKHPTKVHRKSKLNGMTISHWDADISPRGDYVYNTTMEHVIYMEVPFPLQQGQSYAIAPAPSVNTDQTSMGFVFDIFSSVSEAIHINLAGYQLGSGMMAADLYHWMGDGGARSYAAFEGNDVILLNTLTGQQTTAGKVRFWKESGTEGSGYNFAQSDVWTIDFGGAHPPGTYRLVVEGVGCSPVFDIAGDSFAEPYRVATLGYFYMRLGQDSPDMNPRPRLPLFIPGIDSTIVYISDLHPYHPDWQDIRQRTTDPWDHPREFARYASDRTNDNAWGGYSDAYDWDKRLPHVSSIYDMLLPFILTRGAMRNDDFGIAESGNGIPDILDEARYEVDAWLRMRDGMGYAHGISCPYSETNRIRYQGGTTAIAAWANALNSAMLAESFRIADLPTLMQVYLDSATVAFHYADQLGDPMLDLSEGDGTGRIRGRDFRMMAAAFLYNLTGNTAYEDIMKAESVVTSERSPIIDTMKHNQLYGIAAYLTTDRTVNHPALFDQMKASIIQEARTMEAGYTLQRPSRRATCNAAGYFWTLQNVQRSIVAHAVSDDPAEKAFFLNALLLEAGWSLGRNPTNRIQMTTASTRLAGKRSVEFAYTSGYNDGMPGLHPGHTPYWNMNDWAPAMIMGRPSWLASHGYPEQNQWPQAELCFNTDYVWSHTEFTPQQTMRGKNALYGYLYGVYKKSEK
jgi:endoglucanase